MWHPARAGFPTSSSGLIFNDLGPHAIKGTQDGLRIFAAT